MRARVRPPPSLGQAYPVFFNQVRQENLRGELMTENQLQAQLRQAGVRGPEDVEQEVIEAAGHVSVIPRPLGKAPCPEAAESEGQARNLAQLREIVTRNDKQLAECGQMLAEIKKTILEPR